MKKILHTIAPFLIVMVIVSSVFSATGDILQVEITEFEPCVYVGADGEPNGFDIDIWKAVAKDNNWHCNYNVRNVHLDILDNLENKKVDVGIAAFTITSEREEKVDFSHHYLDSGLRILTLREDPDMLSSAIMFWHAIKKPASLFVVFLLLFAHIIWLLERDDNADNDVNGINDKYLPGIFEAIYFCVVTCSTVGYGDYTPKKWMGRLVGVALIFAGIIAFCNFTAILSSEYTTEKIVAIKSIEDLKGKTVITQTNTPAVNALKKLGAKIKEVPTVDQAYDWLLLGRGEALIFDSPIIMSYAQKFPDKVRIVGDVFEKQYYGFAVQEESPLRKDINRSLLKLRETGEYQTIYNKWFDKD